MRFERLLKSVPPTAVRIDPVAAAFVAGQRSTRGQIRIWQSVAAVMLFFGVGGVLLSNTDRNPGIAPSPALAVVQNSAPGPICAQSLIMLQHSVREKGIDGLPAAYVPGGSAGQSVRTSDSL